MAAFNKFQDFSEALCLGEHDLAAAGHQLKVYASNAAPDAALDADKADLAEITAENGYPAGGSDAQNDMTEAAGTATVTCVDVTWTASGGSFGPLRYIVLYNETHANNALIGWWDYGSSVTVLDTETFTVNFAASTLTVA
jgi:hypothetical protein